VEGGEGDQSGLVVVDRSRLCAWYSAQYSTRTYSTRLQYSTSMATTWTMKRTVRIILTRLYLSTAPACGEDISSIYLYNSKTLVQELCEDPVVSGVRYSKVNDLPDCSSQTRQVWSDFDNMFQDGGRQVSSLQRRRRDLDQSRH
jgi:hypothetical protein